MSLLLTFIAILIVALGVGIVARADRVGAAITRFYKSYPLVGHAPNDQFSVRREYVVMLGVAVAALGLAGLVSMLV
jgi:hypothetical protein